MNQDHVREQIVKLLTSGQAHATFEDIVAGFPAKLRGVRPSGSPHSAWELLEHMRIAQSDIVAYTRGTDYKALKFPDDYWPANAEPPDGKAWARSMELFNSDLASMRELLEARNADIFAPLPHAPDATIYGQALLLADHNAYHFGQMMLVRRMLGH